jgi:pyridoxal biosynthesis lyase PdxS
MAKKGSFEIKVGLAEMLKGGVIMDVMNNPRNSKIAEDAGVKILLYGSCSLLVFVFLSMSQVII